MNNYTQGNLNYQIPSREILELADYQCPPGIILSPNKKHLILTYSNTYSSLSELNQTEFRLGGLRFNPITNISSNISYVNDIKLKDLSQGEEKDFYNLPENPRLTYFEFSPNSELLAFTNTTDVGVQLWVADLETRKAKLVLEDFLNANMGKPYRWKKDSCGFIVKVIPAEKKEYIDKSKQIPTGPIVSESSGEISQNRTFQDLLSDKQDEFNFENAMISQLVEANLNGEKKIFLPTDFYLSIISSPDGKYWLIKNIEHPYSYVVPFSRFPFSAKVYNDRGELIKEVNKVPLDEIRAKGFSSTREGIRSMTWHRNKPSTLIYVKALDGGDANKEIEFRDEVYSLEYPFENKPKSLFKTKLRFAGIDYIDDDFILIHEIWYDTRQIISNLINPDTGKIIHVFDDRNYQDIYKDPGVFYRNENKFGEYVIASKDNKVYLFGYGFTPQGQFPFLDEYDLKTGEKERIYTSDVKGKVEDLITFLDFDKMTVLSQVESPTEYPNLYERDMKSGRVRQITHLKNPFESMKNVQKEVIHYKRSDGVDLSGTLYLPVDYDKGGKEKLPLLIWAYPLEHKSKNTAGQNTKNPNEFTYPHYGSFVYWVMKGYAVLDDAAFPILGEGDSEPNDTFIHQLLENGRAAIDAVDSLGYIDRDRVAVGGHSYGAFMTANLLTHGDDFKCGIARSGAYNRTLTPFGFQSEQRNYWDNPDLYNDMSPFMSAHKMKKPLLLIHGEADNNPGTFTLQTERYFQALKNLGAPVRMVILPKESHSYRAKENILHLLWEQDKFLEKHLKNNVEKQSAS